MSVFPGDVVSTSVGVLHVGSVIVERSRAGDSFAVSGATGDGVVHSNIPIGEGMVSLGVDVSDGEALVWFDRERRLSCGRCCGLRRLRLLHCALSRLG